MKFAHAAVWLPALLLTAVARLGPAAEPTLIAAKSLAVFQGEIVEVHVHGEGLSAVDGRFGRERIMFYRGPSGFSAVVGADVEAKPGPAKIIVQGASRSGSHHTAEITVRIKGKSFPKESFSVAPEHEPWTPETIERIRLDREQFARIFAAAAPERFWQGTFIKPVPGDISSPFGLRRIINGTPRALHSGADLRAPDGTEVLAANHGRVALRGEFFFSGKSLVLDHGGGLFTMYFHLSEFKTAEGDLVRKGQVIGLSGMTGRVTGPHLHWAARVNNARIDPLELIGKIRRRAAADGGERAAGKNRE